jgi:hypothetical protein
MGERHHPTAPPLPSCGVAWVSMLPPVVLDQWPIVTARPTLGLTTVANWRSYGSIEYQGVRFGQKAHAFRAVLDLPRAVAPLAVEPALSIAPGDAADSAALRGHGWRLHRPRRVAADVPSYRRFIACSTAEIGIAKSGYVASRCGWFSDRSACYLASGRPVIAQDTGWTSRLPHGDGLLAFDDVAGVAAATDRIMASYDRHRRSARELAEEHLDARRVLTRLLEDVAP